MDEIIAHYREVRGKEFKERIGVFEEFNDPENIHAQQLIHHAHYVAFGHPSKPKEFPGAYMAAHQTLDKHMEEDDDKLEDEDKLMEIMESYVDTFLQQAIGKGGYQEILKHAQEEGADKKTIRDIKSSLLGRFHADEQGRAPDILGDKYIKQMKGRKKVELIDQLRNLAESGKKGYASHLLHKATEGLLDEDDRLDMAKYITPRFKKEGWKHKIPHVARPVELQAQHYAALLQGAGDQLKQGGYKHHKHQEER